MTATNFNTRNSTFRQLMGTGLSYRIPRFQRDYSWTDEEWEDLWLDSLGTITPGGEPAHYMGYLVLQTHDEKSFEVIDGQQRLTTLSIVVLAVLKNLQRLVDSGIEAEKNKRRLEQIRQSYIGYLDPVTLVPSSKLALNRNNDHYYQAFLVQLSPLPQRGFRASEHALRKAFEYFDPKVGEYARSSGDDQGVELASFVETLTDRLFFTVITVTDELNAYKVFETLNARGVRLSATDLLKNYLFSVLYRENRHEHEFKALEDRWEAVVSRLGSDSFPEFLRVHWNSRRTAVRQTELFKTIRNQITTSRQVFELMASIDEDLETYLSLTQPDSSSWPKDWRENSGLLRMFSVKQPFPLLVAIKRELSDADFELVLTACVVISFRYNVVGSLSTGDQEGVYNNVTRGVFDGKYQTGADVIGGLSRIYPNDAQFKEAFAAKSLRATQSRNKRIVRYVLCQIEKQCSGRDLDFDSDSLTIEHILPRNPEGGWDQFSEMELSEYVHRLGNVTLMEKGTNKDLGNVSFESKTEAFKESVFETTKRIETDHPRWDTERIESRQRWMAKQATSLWKISQLSS